MGEHQGTRKGPEMNQMEKQRLAAWLSQVLREEVTIGQITRLSGGAIQENWALSLRHEDGRMEELVLRRDSRATIGSSGSRTSEFHILEAAHHAGLAVARPIALCASTEVLGRPFFLMTRIAGVADPRRLVRDDALVPDRAALGRAIGTELARIHAIHPPAPAFACLGLPDPDPSAARIQSLRRALDQLFEPEPAIEWVLRRLERCRPRPRLTALVHGDYRMGNVMVAGGRLAGVLDWEFAGWGDPDEDLGWFCARCWRFGRVDREAGGLAERKDFYAGYEARAGRTIDPARIRYWEAMAAIRWAIVALEQGTRYRMEEKPGLEAALTGRMAPQLVEEAMAMVARLSDA